ncbi:MAG: alpha/beta fold hydrolase [Micropepsaceae bacterium]
MSATFRYEWGTRFEDRLPSPLDPVSLGTLSWRDGSVNAAVYRGRLSAADGYALPYRLWSPRSPRGAILLLHGVCEYAGAFDAIAPYFAALGYAALAFDQRGFGQTQTRGKWAGKSRMSHDIRDALRYLAGRVPDVPLYVLGESMGAALAVHASAQGHTAGVSGMVLVAPGALGCTMRRISFGLAARALQAIGARADLFVERINADGLTPDTAIRLLADPLILRRISPALVCGILRLGLSAFDDAPAVAAPTLTLVGSGEDVSPLRCIRALHRRFPSDASLVEFEGGPHMLLHWVKREAVLNTIATWLSERTGSQTGGPSASLPPFSDR